jgi:hypothetical protein
LEVVVADENTFFILLKNEGSTVAASEASSGAFSESVFAEGAADHEGNTFLHDNEMLSRNE